MKSDIIVTKGFFKKVELSKNIDKYYSNAIDDLRNVKKHFRHPLTIKSIDSLLNGDTLAWIKYPRIADLYQRFF